MLKTIFSSRLYLFGLALSLGLCTPTLAQSTIDAAATATVPFHFPLVVGTTDILLRIDQCVSVGLTMPSPRGDLSLLLMDPTGAVFNPADSTQTTVQMFVSPDPLVSPAESLYVYNLSLNNPLKGDWKLRVGLPVAGTTYRATAKTDPLATELLTP